MLHSIAPDIELYEKEKKRQSKSGAPWGGKRAADLAEKEKERKAAEKEAKEAEEREKEAEEVAKRPNKKPRPSLPDVDTRIILTGFTRWVDDQNKEDNDRVQYSSGN